MSQPASRAEAGPNEALVSATSRAAASSDLPRPLGAGASFIFVVSSIRWWPGVSSSEVRCC